MKVYNMVSVKRGSEVINVLQIKFTQKAMKYFYNTK